MRSVDESTAKLIAGTEEDRQQPLFSPDGKWIGYSSLADGKLKKISVSGGPPVTLCDGKAFFGASWGTDNTIVYSDGLKGIMRVSANAEIKGLRWTGSACSEYLRCLEP